MSTTKNNGFDMFFSTEKMTEFWKGMQVPSVPAVDVESWLDIQKKNIETAAKVNETAFNYWQKLAKQQTEAASQFVSEQSKAMMETLSSPTPEQGLQKQAELMQKSYETSMRDAQAAGELLAKMNDEVVDMVGKRMNAGLGEVKNAMSAATGTKGKKAA